ncbi:MAG: DMT family transporter [Pseudomonadota bacterium]
MWVITAIGCAAAFGSAGLLVRFFGGDIRDRHLPFLIQFFCWPVYLVYLITTGIPAIDPYVAFYGATSIGINLVAYPMFLRALKRVDLSIVYPLIGTSPAWMALWGVLILGEVPGPRGMAGIILIVAGIYIVGSSGGLKGFLAPLASLVRIHETRSVLLVALMWSFAGAMDKKAVLASSPAFYLLAWVSLFVPLYALIYKININPFNYVRKIMFISAGETTAMILQLVSFTMAPAAYVIAIKRSGLLVGVLAGLIIFREKSAGRKLLGSLIVVSGIILLTVS